MVIPMKGTEMKTLELTDEQYSELLRELGATLTVDGLTAAQRGRVVLESILGREAVVA